MEPSTNADAQNSDTQDDCKEPVTTNKNRSVTSEEPSQENPDSTPHSPTVTPHYNSIMEDEALDEVFIQPPFLPSSLDPEGGSTCQAAANYMSVSLRSSDATAANTNPECLEWHHGERQIMTIHSQENEEMDNAITNFGSVERRSSSASSGIQCVGQDLKLMQGRAVQNSGEKVEESNEKQDQMEFKAMVDVELLEEADLNCACQNLEGQNLENVIGEDQSKADVSITQNSDNSEEDGIDGKLAEGKTLDSELKGYDWVKRTSVENVEETVTIEHRELNPQEHDSTETCQDSSIATEILQGEDLLQRLQLVQKRQELAVTCQDTAKLEQGAARKCSVDGEDPETVQAIQDEELTEQEPKVETPELTEHVEHCSNHNTAGRCDEDCETRNFENETEISANNDACTHLGQEIKESECKEKQIVVTDQVTGDTSLEDECPKTEGADEEEQTCAEEHADSNDEGDSQKIQERTSLSPLSHQKQDRKGSDIETDSWTNENTVLFPSCHRYSAAETHIEKHFHNIHSQLKKDLQRAEGVLDLSDNPDVLEIPFKSNISLEPLPIRDDTAQSSEWHFSEQKMQKEISQEMQRELVLVNLGKIPGGYSKGESRQMKDTKMLFEEFQQDKTEGPTRIRKPQPSSQIYPSVLERTRSLEMFSHKLSPMLRTHSFRLVSSSEKEKHPETFRPQSPSLRDKARLSPYPKHEKLPRKHKSMDAINMLSPTTAVDKVRNSKEEPVREGSPLLKENPFFKLRPALSLQPEVEKDIREAKKREEELRKQRSSLYGETRQVSKEDGKSTALLQTGSKQKPAGRLERVWPPPSTKDQSKAEQQEARVQRTPGHRAALWQRWESGLINGQTPTSTNNNN